MFVAHACVRFLIRAIVCMFCVRIEVWPNRMLRVNLGPDDMKLNSLLPLHRKDCQMILFLMQTVIQRSR